jgi:hypothetical protein
MKLTPGSFHVTATVSRAQTTSAPAWAPATDVHRLTIAHDGECHGQRENRQRGGVHGTECRSTAPFPSRCERA